VVTGLLLTFNYWWALIFFFLSLLIFVWFSLDEDQVRGLWLLLIFCLFVAVLAGSLASLFSYDLLTSSLIGLIAALIGVVIPFLLLVAIAAIGLLKWHKKDEHSSFFKAFWYLLESVLGFSCFSITIENGEKVGAAKDIDRLEHFGGPGGLIVYPGQVVVLHHWGKFTRVIGVGPTRLKRREQIKAVIELTPRVMPKKAKTMGENDNLVKDVLTQDRIPLQMTVFHIAQLEPASETKARFQQAVDNALARLKSASGDEEKQKAQQALDQAKAQLQALANDKIIGDEHNQCYESIAKLVAARGADVWEMSRGVVTNSLRDVVMSERFENLFKIDEGTEDLAARVSHRKILEIENLTLEKAKQIEVNDGVTLKIVDIQRVEFPPAIANQLNKEVAIVIEERIEQTRTRLEESKAKGKVIKAQAEAQARMLDGQGLGEARAAEFREILHELKHEEALPDDQAATMALRLMRLGGSRRRSRGSKTASETTTDESFAKFYQRDRS
jgi:hypothetical protein